MKFLLEVQSNRNNSSNKRKRIRKRIENKRFTLVVVYINTMKTTFYFNLLISTKLLNSMDAHKIRNKKKRSIISFSLVTCKLVIEKSLFRSKTWIKKSSSLYWYKLRTLDKISEGKKQKNIKELYKRSGEYRVPLRLKPKLNCFDLSNPGQRRDGVQRQ